MKRLEQMEYGTFSNIHSGNRVDLEFPKSVKNMPLTDRVEEITPWKKKKKSPQELGSPQSMTRDLRLITVRVQAPTAVMYMQARSIPYESQEIVRRRKGPCEFVVNCPPALIW